MTNYLDGLNKEQKQAVLEKDGAILVLAGAGSGKTRVITKRILHLVSLGAASPDEILSITFTNKAAMEMRERSFKELSEELNFKEGDPMPFISTFHSLGVWLLRKYGENLGIRKRFSIYDKSDSLKIIKDILKNKGLDTKIHPPQKYLAIISKNKGSGLSFADMEKNSNRSSFERHLFLIWQDYEERLREENALDFDDLILKSYMLLRDDKRVRQEASGNWKYVQIDEYQDTNRVQYYMAKLLSSSHGNILAVGDADQNIYSWRGASLDNILGFKRDFKDAKIINLAINYRSTKKIVEAAETIIEKNTKRLPKEVRTLNAEGEPVRLFTADNEKSEAQFIAQKTEEKMREGIFGGEIAVLYRAHFQSRAIEEEFLRLGIPYQVIGVKFFERKEVKDVLSFIEAALNRDSRTHLARIINVPPRGIGKVTLLKILAGKKESLGRAMSAKVLNFNKMLDEIEEAVNRMQPSETLRFVIERTGMKKLFEEGDEEDRERLLNIEELVTLAQKYDNLEPRDGIEKLLEESALRSDEETLETETANTVKLLTVHGAKGLEFDVVFVAGLEDGLFPIVRDGKQDEAEEERRLFYVALTRARKTLFITHAMTRLIYGSRELNSPSEFIIDIEKLLSPAEKELRTFYLD